MRLVRIGPIGRARPLAAAVALVLAGCATPVSIDRWTAVRHTDPFTDQTSCRVIPSGFQSGDGPVVAFTTPFHFYPFVEVHAGSLRVGVTSGGRFKIPTGRVQLRVDDDPSWTIDTSETPLDMVAGLSGASMAGTSNAGAEDAMTRAQRAAVAMVGQASSPFTAATGAKAQAILAQMKTGRELIYRITGFNQPGSTLGQTALGSDFLDALRQCGL